MRDIELKPFNFQFERTTLDQWMEFVKVNPSGFFPAGPIYNRVADQANNMQLIALGGRNSSSMNDPEFMPSYFSLVWRGQLVQFAVYLESKVINESYKTEICKVWSANCPKSLESDAGTVTDAFHAALSALLTANYGVTPNYPHKSLVILPFNYHFS